MNVLEELAQANEKNKNASWPRRMLIGGRSWHGWGLHVCQLDYFDRVSGAPHRVHVLTPWGQLIIATRRGDGTQLWLPWKTTTRWGGVVRRSNYSRFVSPIVWHPRDRTAQQDEAAPGSMSDES